MGNSLTPVEGEVGVFLGYDFSLSSRKSGKILVIQEETSTSLGTVKKIALRDLKNVPFVEKCDHFFCSSYYLDQVAEYVMEQADAWLRSLPEKKDQQLLEKQFALLSRKITKHNRRSFHDISFKNPFAITIYASVKYETKSEEDKEFQVHFPRYSIKYDCLSESSLIHTLMGKIQHDKLPLTVTSQRINSGNKAEICLFESPACLFSNTKWELPPNFPSFQYGADNTMVLRCSKINTWVLVHEAYKTGFRQGTNNGVEIGRGDAVSAFIRNHNSLNHL